MADMVDVYFPAHLHGNGYWHYPPGLMLRYFYRKQAASRPSGQAHDARLALLLRLQRDNSLMVVYLGRCPRLYTAALSARIAHAGLRMVVMVPILAISPWPWGVLTVCVAHAGLRMVAVVPILAISPWPCGVLSACVAHAGLRMVAVVPILAISPWPWGVLSARVAPHGFARCPTGLFMGNLENIGNHFRGLGNVFQPMGSAFYLFTLLRFYFSRPSFGVGQWWPAPWLP